MNLLALQTNSYHPQDDSPVNNSRNDLTGEFLLESLQRLLEADPCIDEVGFLLSEEIQKYKSCSSSSTNTIIFEGNGTMFVDYNSHKLGIAFDCIPKLFKQCSYQWRTSMECFNCGSRDITTLKNLEVGSRLAIMINADNYSALNARKELILINYISEMAEISALNVVFSKHPKSSEAWEHRRWVIQRLISGMLWTEESLWSTKKNVWKGEITVCSNIALKYPSNYYCWSHRGWFIRQFVCRSLLPTPVILECLQEELSISESWIGSHVGDHAGFHYRQVILLMLLKIEESDLLLREADRLYHLIHFFDAHESLWQHLRFVADQCLHSGSATLISTVAGHLKFCVGLVRMCSANGLLEKMTLAIQFMGWLFLVADAACSGLYENEKVVLFNGLHEMKTRTHSILSEALGDNLHLSLPMLYIMQR